MINILKKNNPTKKNKNNNTEIMIRPIKKPIQPIFLKKGNL